MPSDLPPLAELLAAARPLADAAAKLPNVDWSKVDLATVLAGARQLYSNPQVRANTTRAAYVSMLHEPPKPKP